MAMWRSIVCGIDGKPGCIDAVRLAARLAREQPAELVLLHAEPEGESEALLAPPASRRAAAREDHTLRLAGLASDVRGEPVRTERAIGDPAERLVAFAKRSGCDLIVIGSHSRSRATLALTSVAGKVVAHAPCPVLIVPSGMEDLKPDFPGQVA